MPGHYDTTDPYSVSSTKSNQNYGSASKSGMQSKQNFGGSSSSSKSEMQSKQTNVSSSKGFMQGKQSSWNNGYDKTNQVSPNHPSGAYQDNKTKPYRTYNSTSNSDKNAGFVNKELNDDKYENDYKNPNEETRQAGLDYITSTTGETELEYWTTRKEISDYNNEHNFGDATIDLDNAEVRKLWNEAKDIIGDETITKKSMIKALNQLEDEGKKTFGTGLRGDARWTGYIGTRDDYSNKLSIMAGNYDTTSTIGKYQRALINANKPLRGTTGDKIFSALLSVIGGPVGTAVAVGSEIIKNLTPEKTELPSDGIFVFEVSYLLDVIQKVLLGTIFHEHHSYHSLKPLVKFMKRYDMEIIDVERVTIQGGSLIGTAQLIGGPHKISSSVNKPPSPFEDVLVDKRCTIAAIFIS